METDTINNSMNMKATIVKYFSTGHGEVILVVGKSKDGTKKAFTALVYEQSKDSIQYALDYGTEVPQKDLQDICQKLL